MTRIILLLISFFLLNSVVLAAYNRFVIIELENEQYVVLDVVTDLIWQKDFATDKTWSQALEHCEDLVYAGQSDWRLPNKKELISLINFEAQLPASDFPDMPSFFFWSSTSSAKNESRAWDPNFEYGLVNYNEKTTKSNVRCVLNKKFEDLTIP